jgi:hypothetical protein
VIPFGRKRGFSATYLSKKVSEAFAKGLATQYEIQEIREKKAWNDAIEEAASMIPQDFGWGVVLAENIRSLKKSEKDNLHKMRADKPQRRLR